jgi:hypothetical protein
MVFIKKLSLHGIFFSGLEMLASVSDSAFIELPLQSLVWLMPLVAKTGNIPISTEDSSMMKELQVSFGWV